MGRKKTNSKAVSYDENRQTDSEESDNEVFISKELRTHKLMVQKWCPQIAVSLLVPSL